MPTITLTITPAQATRIAAMLAKTDYPATLVGYKALLVDYTRSLVGEYERAQAERAALATVVPAAPLDVS